MAPKPLLFISHSSSDTAVAKQVHTVLAGEFEIFLDAYDLRAGADWQKSIESAIVRCDCAVVILSPNVKAKPEWVAAEAYALSLRQRALDAGFLVIPILMPGFTVDDLSQGPLGPANLKAIEGVSLDPAALDLQPLVDGLNPVRTNYHARLAYQPVTLSLASVIGPLGPHAQEIIANSLGLDKNQLTYAADRSLWLAAALLRTDRATIEKAYEDLSPTQPDAAKQIFRIAAPYSWVDRDAADAITRTGLLPKSSRVPLTVGATRAETPKFCVLRGSLKAGGWKTFDADAVFGGDAQQPGAPDARQMLLDNIRKSLQKVAGFDDDESPSDDEIDAVLDDSPLKEEPIFVFLEPWFARQDGALMRELTTSFPRLVFMIRTDAPQTSLSQKLPGIVVLPSLATHVETNVYRMYKRCLPGVRLP